MKGDRPAKGSPEKREWVFARLRDALELSGVRPDRFTVAVMRRVAVENPEESWPCNDDVALLGGWAAVRALAFAGIDAPTKRDLADVRGVRRDVSYQRSLERQVGDQTHTTDRLRDLFAEAVQANPARISRLSKPALPPVDTLSACETVAFISDVHFGAIIDPREVPGGGYDWQIAARHLAGRGVQAAPSRSLDASPALGRGHDRVRDPWARPSPRRAGDAG